MLKTQLILASRSSIAYLSLDPSVFHSHFLNDAADFGSKLQPLLAMLRSSYNTAHFGLDLFHLLFNYLTCSRFGLLT